MGDENPADGKISELAALFSQSRRHHDNMTHHYAEAGRYFQEKSQLTFSGPEFDILDESERSEANEGAECQDNRDELYRSIVSSADSWEQCERVLKGAHACYEESRDLRSMWDRSKGVGQKATSDATSDSCCELPRIICRPPGSIID